MSEWELVPPEELEMVNNKVSEWELAPPDETKESLLTSLMLAPYRVTSDVGTALYEGASKIPQYYESAKTEFPGLVQTMREHPGRIGLQGVAGSQEAINKIAQLPLGLSQYISQRLNLLPEEIPQAIAKITPEDTQQAINDLFGQPQYPGEALARGAIRNIPEILAGKQILNVANPLKYTKENIAKDIVKSRKEMYQKYSGEKGLYPELFKEAREEGLGVVKINPNKINIEEIKEFANPKYTDSLEKLLSNPEIEIAQSAQSDLKKFINFMNKKESLTKAEQKSLNAAKEAQEHIVDKMFEGNQNLREKYGIISEGYGKEYRPYKNKNINEYMKGELLAQELIPKLQKGKFAAMRGKNHPEMFRAEAIKKALTVLGLGGAAFSAKPLYEAIYGKID